MNWLQFESTDSFRRKRSEIQAPCANQIAEEVDGVRKIFTFFYFECGVSAVQ